MIFEKVYEMDNLEHAWERVRANKGPPGIDKVRWEDFEKDLAYNLQILHKQLQEETYRPLPVVVFKDHRTKKEGRSIGIATVRDRVVQQAILKATTPHFEKIFLPCAHAYRPGRSALSAIAKASQLIKAGHLWVLQMDVENFFDSMDHGLMLELIGRVIDEKPLIGLVARLLKAKIFREMGLFDNVMGSHQGSGLSPLLSNIYLHPMDRFLWDKYKDRYLRYSDDIALLAKEKEELEEARAHIERCLQELKLAPHPQKTAITHIADGIVYLGYYMDIKGKGPDKKSVEGLQAKLAAYDKVLRTDNITEKLDDVTAIIRGWYGYYKTLRPIKPGNILTVLALSRLAHEYGEHQLARQLLKEGADLKHTHPQIAFQMGQLFSSLGMHNQAMREYAKAVQLDPHLEMAKEKVKELQSGEEDIYRAVEKVQVLLHHNPHYRDGYAKLAEYYTELGLYGFAEKAHEKLLEIDDDSAAGSAPSLQGRPVEDAIKNGFEYHDVDLEDFLRTFRGRTDAHAKQWVDERGRWGFMHVDRGLKKKDIYRHLKGDETLAIYPVTEKDTVYFIVFDVDTAKRILLEADPASRKDFENRAHQDVLRIKAVCEQMGFTLYVEDSGYKGRHGWLFFDEELEAAFAIQLGQEVVKRAGGPAEGMIWELFPMGKSERHKSLIKLPLGINRKSNRRCLFLNEENQPLPDQALLLKTIRRAGVMDVQGVFRDMLPAKKLEEAEEHALPPGLKKMIESCKVIRHLMKKAEDTNYLNHYERMCLLYTLSFAGEDGCKLLHKVISHCINYNYQYTQRQIERRKESPMSCPKIMEIFPELTESLPCDCKFDVPPRGYPSPVLYILEAEMEKGKIIPMLGREVEEEHQEEQAAEGEARQGQEERILDFERIFSDEWNQEAAQKAPQASAESTEDRPLEVSDQRVQTADQPGPEDAGEMAISPDKEAPAAAEQAPAAAPGQALDEAYGRALGEPHGQALASQKKPQTVALERLGHEVREKEENIAKILAGKEHASQETEQLEAWRTALEYLRLRYNEERVTQGLNEVTDKLEALFKDRNTDSIETRLGIIRRVRSDEGKTGWVVIGG